MMIDLKLKNKMVENMTGSLIRRSLMQAHRSSRMLFWVLMVMQPATEGKILFHFGEE